MPEVDHLDGNVFNILKLFSEKFWFLVFFAFRKSSPFQLLCRKILSSLCNFQCNRRSQSHVGLWLTNKPRKLIKFCWKKMTKIFGSQNFERNLNISDCETSFINAPIRNIWCQKSIFWMVMFSIYSSYFPKNSDFWSFLLSEKVVLFSYFVGKFSVNDFCLSTRWSQLLGNQNNLGFAENSK